MKHKKHRESWKSKIGFIFAALGSAVGLGSIWRFPYIVGENGGAAFLFLYLIFVIIIALPILISEILIGRKTQMNPYGAFDSIAKNQSWARFGKLTILTGFLISSFYAVVSGWTLGYFIEALTNHLSWMTTPGETASLFANLSSSAFWSVGYHFLFILLAIAVLFSGVRKGIEAGSKVMMPLLFVLLLILVVKGLMMDQYHLGLQFLFSPNFDHVTPKVILLALGQAFFTLSLGQGTMVTYGSYLSKKEDIAGSCIPVVLLNLLISVLMGVAIFSILFAVGMQPSAGTALVFEVLPLVFSKLSWGWAFGSLFFLLTTLAALTSLISALEPFISYLIDEKRFSRKKATLTAAFSAFIVGVPSSLSFGLLKDFTLFGKNFFDLISFVSINLLVPIGGLLAALLVGFKWGIKGVKEELITSKSIFYQRDYLFRAFAFSIRYLAPLVIFLILLDMFF